MIRKLAFGLLLVLAGCNRSGVADVTLDADASQRNATAAKTLDDLAAASQASIGPAPIVRDAAPVDRSATNVAEPEERAAAEPSASDADADANGDADSAPPTNDMATAQPDAR